MEVNQINEVLKDLEEHTLKSKYNQVANETPKDYWEEKSQEINSVKTEIYKLNIEDWHLKVQRTTDSYGENESLCGVSFVKPIVKQITDFQ